MVKPVVKLVVKLVAKPVVKPVVPVKKSGKITVMKFLMTKASG